MSFNHDLPLNLLRLFSLLRVFVDPGERINFFRVYYLPTSDYQRNDPMFCLDLTVSLFFNSRLSRSALMHLFPPQADLLTIDAPMERSRHLLVPQALFLTPGETFFSRAFFPPATVYSRRPTISHLCSMIPRSTPPFYLPPNDRRCSR